MKRGDLVKLSYNPYSFLGIVLRTHEDDFLNALFADVWWSTGRLEKEWARDLEILNETG